MNRVLEGAGIDGFVEGIVRGVLRGADGPPESTPPGRYFRVLFIGDFEGLSSERGIAWRVAYSLSLRSFLDLDLTEPAPDHSTLSRTRRLIDVQTHVAVFTWMLEQLADGNEKRTSLLRQPFHPHSNALPGGLREPPNKCSRTGVPATLSAGHARQIVLLDPDVAPCELAGCWPNPLAAIVCCPHLERCCAGSDPTGTADALHDPRGSPTTQNSFDGIARSPFSSSSTSGISSLPFLATKGSSVELRGCNDRTRCLAQPPATRMPAPVNHTARSSRRHLFHNRPIRPNRRESVEPRIPTQVSKPTSRQLQHLLFTRRYNELPRPCVPT